MGWGLGEGQGMVWMRARVLATSWARLEQGGQDGLHDTGQRRC